MNNFLELITIGPVYASLKAFFFFLPFDKKINVEIEKQVDIKMEKFKNTFNPNIVRNTLRWLEDDDFSKNLEKDYSGQFYINELIGLKESYLDFFKMYVHEILKSDSNLTQVADLISKNEEHILQIARLRMVIDPEIQLSKNIHKQTKITYMKVKGFWLNDEGVKERRYFKSLGRFDSFPKGVKDETAILEGRNKIREEVLADYLNDYKT